MVICMRTTLDLDDALIAKARSRAQARGLTLTAVIEEALARELLAAPEAGPEFRLQFVLFEGTTRAPVDISDRRALYDFLDDRS